MQRIFEALRRDGIDPNEVECLRQAGDDLEAFWRDCEDPEWMIRIAGVAGVDPRHTVGAACEAAGAVTSYAAPGDGRLEAAVGCALAWLRGEADARMLDAAAQQAEQAAAAYAEARKGGDPAARRSYRAAAYAAQAAARAARAALAGAVVMELEYDQDYTFEDAWAGAAPTCAQEAIRAVHDVVEAAVSATAARVSAETGSEIAGKAAAHEGRGEVRQWVAGLVRAQIAPQAVQEAAARVLGRTPGAEKLRESR